MLDLTLISWLLVGMLATLLWIARRQAKVDVEIIYEPNGIHSQVVKRCPSLHVPWSVPLLWGTSPLLQTILGGSIRAPPALEYEREIIHDKEGGSVHIDWFNRQREHLDDPSSIATIVIIPGVGGCSQTTYIRNFVRYCHARHKQWQFVILNHRGCNSPVTSPRLAQYGCSKDFRRMVKQVVRSLETSKIETPIFGVAFSMGANIMVNYLADYAEKGTHLTSAVSIGQGYHIETCMREVGALYMKLVVGKMKNLVLRNRHIFQEHVNCNAIADAKTLKEFDELFSCPVYGYKSAEEYWKHHSSGLKLDSIKTPLLLLNAKDDPLVAEAALPRAATLKNKDVMLVVTSAGGHLGFVSSEFWGLGWSKASWMDKVSHEFILASYTVLQPRRS